VPLGSFNISGWTWSRIVETEENVRAHATYALHIPVEEVLKMLGVKGRFALAGGSSPVVGDPDFSWVVGPAQPRPKVMVCALVTVCGHVKR
jgi:hypothetical protein